MGTNHNNCNSFVEKINKTGIFDECIDATYIIHFIEKPDRRKDFETQLEKYKPSKIVYILENKGLTCEKGLHITIPPIDLIDAFYQLFILFCLFSIINRFSRT